MAQRFSGLLTNNALKMCMSSVPKYKSNTAGSNVGAGTDRKTKEEMKPGKKQYTPDMKDRKEFIPLNPSKNLKKPSSGDIKKEQEEYAKHEKEHEREGKRAQERDE